MADVVTVIKGIRHHNRLQTAQQNNMNATKGASNKMTLC
jgi:hypothetical protein